MIHLQGPCWKEASKILKLAVTRSSSLTFSGSSEDFDVPRGRELPGRTMDFNVDLAHITALSTDTSSMDLFSPRKTDSIRRPTWQSQVKIREHLVNLLNASGLRVGLPKSPSVSKKLYLLIFFYIFMYFRAYRIRQLTK